MRPGENHAEVALTQIRGLLADLAATGRQTPDTPPPVVVLDSGNDPSVPWMHTSARLCGRRSFSAVR